MPGCWSNQVFGSLVSGMSSHQEQGEKKGKKHTVGSAALPPRAAVLMLAEADRIPPRAWAFAKPLGFHVCEPFRS